MSDDSRDRPGHRRMSVAEASKVLGISESAVRKRVERGKLEHEHTSDGRLTVYLAARDSVRDSSRYSHETAATERYVSSLEDQVEYLRRQLDQERRANDENRRLLAAALERIPELPPAPPQEPSESPTEATEQPGRVGPQTPLGGAQGGAERPWWRRVFER